MTKIPGVTSPNRKYFDLGYQMGKADADKYAYQQGIMDTQTKIQDVLGIGEFVKQEIEYATPSDLGGMDCECCHCKNK